MRDDDSDARGGDLCFYVDIYPVLAKTNALFTLRYHYFRPVDTNREVSLTQRGESLLSIAFVPRVHSFFTMIQSWHG